MSKFENPFPGLRPFRSREAPIFFGRDEQCDELLSRLSKRRLVGVVGASGSGKSSLVRAGLLPALRRGYLPVAGSSWLIAKFRPGRDPLANLTTALLDAQPRSAQALSRDAVERLLNRSSLGLVDTARTLVAESGASLLVLVDQFEEIFTFQNLAADRDEAEERAAECVQLLLGAVSQDVVPVYIVLTMRSDYLGSCAQFSGLPEALNDSQFLVPRMTREQLRAAIEGPVAVGGGRITPRLVQRLLHDVDAMSSRAPQSAGVASRGEYDHDQLPVLQHALMRMWEVSSAARRAGGAIDLQHYEDPPVETIGHALDRHAEEVYRDLPDDEHRAVARRLFQRLTERDWENREVRRPTHHDELIDVAAPKLSREQRVALVDKVIAEFAAPGRAFVTINDQHDVDISHESFIRKWNRLREWVQDESQSRQTYVRLAETALEWDQGRASLYRGAQLELADQWWRSARPTETWARRYHAAFSTADRFLQRSLRQRRREWLSIGLGIAAVLAVAVVMTILWMQARELQRTAQAAEQRAVVAEGDAKQARSRAESVAGELKQALEKVAASAPAGSPARAEAVAALQSANTVSTLTPAEAREVERLRGETQSLNKQLAEANSRLTAMSVAAGTSGETLEKITKERDGLNERNGKLADELRLANAERTDLRTKLEDATAELNKANAARDSLAKRLDAALAPPGSDAQNALKGDYAFLFERGLVAKSRGQLREAERYFEAAARIRGDTGEPIQLEPRGSEPYLPNYQLGLVRKQLACDAWSSLLKLTTRVEALRDLNAKMQQLACEAR